YRNKAARADKLVAELTAGGATAHAVGADLTDADSVAALAERVQATAGGLDLLVLNASGGMEAGLGADYAMRLNRDAQIRVLDAFLPLLAGGGRVVFVTSHQAHFI